MTTDRKINIILGALLLAVLAFIGWNILKTHDALIRATEQTKAADAIKAVKDKAIADRDALTSQYAKVISQQVAQVTTAPQAVKIITQYVPSSLPQVVVQKSELTPTEQAKLPDAPAYVITTQAQAVDEAKALLRCDLTAHELTACQADLVDTKAKEVATEKEVTLWRDTAKGGSKWQRIKIAGKWLLVGVAAAEVTRLAMGK